MRLPRAPFAVIAALHLWDDGGETLKLGKSFQIWFLSRYDSLFKDAHPSVALTGFAEL